tara:strand:+ start:81 stop:686 length:606 start_codon:yes stop_codon:yes gene_type:complete
MPRYLAPGDVRIETREEEHYDSSHLDHTNRRMDPGLRAQLEREAREAEEAEARSLGELDDELDDVSVDSDENDDERQAGEEQLQEAENSGDPHAIWAVFVRAYNSWALSVIEKGRAAKAAGDHATAGAWIRGGLVALGDLGVAVRVVEAKMQEENSSLRQQLGSITSIGGGLRYKRKVKKTKKRNKKKKGKSKRSKRSRRH